MSKEPSEADALRTEAEAQLTRAPPIEVPSPPPRQILHELRVHQVELEMQNEELRRSQLALEESRDRYIDLYEFAPVGYFTLNREGMIVEVNLTGSALLGVERKQLLNRRFSGFVSAGDSDRWHHHFLNVLQHDGQRCELALKRGDGSVIHAQLDCRKTNIGNEFSIRVALTDITERKLGEESLRESEEIFRLFIDHAPVSLAMFDREMRYLAVSRRWKEDYFLGGRDIIGISHYEIFPEIQEGWKDVHRRGLAGEVIRADGDRFERADGTIQWLCWEVLPWHSGDGAIGGIVIFSEDITRYKQAEDEIRRLNAALEQRVEERTAQLTAEIVLREQKEQALMQVAAIIESSDDAIIGNTLEGIVTSWNGGAERMFGYSREEAQGRPISFLIPEQYQHEEATLLERIRSGDLVNHYETVRRCKEGKLIDVSVSISPIRDQDGKIVGASKIARNITERKKIEQELRIAATAFEAQVGMTVYAADGTILRVNHAFTSITGYTAEEAIGKSPRILKSGRHDANFYAAMWASINNTGAWEGEILNRRKNGEIYPEHLSITAVKNADGITTNYVGTFTDITLQKAAEHEIRQLAFYDPLTCLPNRRLLNDRLGQTMAAHKRSGCYGALMFLDLDNFKPLNDTYGHGVGDLLLVEVARRISNCVRETDTVARFGGDEFVVMLTELDADKTESAAQASAVAEKIRVTLAEPYLLTVKHEGQAECTIEHHCTSSIGVKLFIAHEANMEDIIKWADMAMYQAKEDGRNLIRFYEVEG